MGCKSWALTAGQCNNLNVHFNSWICAMSRMTKWDLQIISIRDEELRKCLGIDSLNEILDQRYINWTEKVAKKSTTLDDNWLLPKLLCAWCFGGKRQQGGQLKTLHKPYLYLLCKLQFDTKDTSDSASSTSLTSLLLCHILFHFVGPPL